jgi:hypothetical protein
LWRKVERMRGMRGRMVETGVVGGVGDWRGRETSRNKREPSNGRHKVIQN